MNVRPKRVPRLWCALQGLLPLEAALVPARRAGAPRVFALPLRPSRTAAVDAGERRARIHVALIDAAAVKQAVLVGHSMGSLAALDCAARHPGRVSAIALIGTAFPMKVSAELLAAKRAASDALQVRLTERMRPQPTVDADTETATGTITRYEPWALPRGNLVFEMPSRRVEAEFDTMAECETHADQLNKWLAARPAPDRRYRMFVPPAERTEAELVAMVDSIFEPERVPLGDLQTTQAHLEAERGKDDLS